MMLLEDTGELRAQSWWSVKSVFKLTPISLWASKLGSPSLGSTVKVKVSPHSYSGSIQHLIC
jgi:hypothetical protein